jgi:hypothetical protein
VKDKISQLFNNHEIITAAIQKGINTALLRHKQLGMPVCVWRNGKVVWIAPKNIKANLFARKCKTNRR